MARCAGSQPERGSCQVNFVRVLRILSRRAPECAPVGVSPEIKGLFSGFTPFPEDTLQGPWSCWAAASIEAALLCGTRCMFAP